MTAYFVDFCLSAFTRAFERLHLLVRVLMMVSPLVTGT